MAPAGGEAGRGDACCTGTLAADLGRGNKHTLHLLLSGHSAARLPLASYCLLAVGHDHRTWLQGRAGCGFGSGSDTSKADSIEKSKHAIEDA